MLNLEHGIDSLTNFKRQTADYLRQLHESGSPMVLTVNGKVEVVVQDAAAYQRLVAPDAVRCEFATRSTTGESCIASTPMPS